MEKQKINQLKKETEASSTQAATSTKRPNPFRILLDDIHERNGERSRKLARCQVWLPFSFDEFRKLLVAEGSALLEWKRQRVPFVIDAANEPAIRQLWLYSTGNRDFEGDLRKGIMLQGKVGCGKSILLESYVNLLDHYIDKFELFVVAPLFITSNRLSQEIVKGEMSRFTIRTLAIDEFGREPKTAMDYGNTIRPLTELFHLRSDNGSLTHGTTNFTLDTLSGDEFYGRMIGDRLRAMFNFITLAGESRRQ